MMGVMAPCANGTLGIGSLPDTEVWLPLIKQLATAATVGRKVKGNIEPSREWPVGINVR